MDFRIAVIEASSMRIFFFGGIGSRIYDYLYEIWVIQSSGADKGAHKDKRRHVKSDRSQKASNSPPRRLRRPGYEGTVFLPSVRQ